MMDIKALREKCQSSRKSCDTWYGLNFARKISIYITCLFVKIRINAMGATTIFLLNGIAAALVFSFGGRVSTLIGALLLQLWYVMDHVDGEVARYNEESSLTGVYYDEVVHYIVHPLVFFGIGFGLFQIKGNMIYIVSGMLAGLSIMLLSIIVDIKKVVLLSNTEKKEGAVLDDNSDEGPESLPKKVFSKVYSFCTYPFIMNVITIAAIIDFLAGTMLISVVLLGYAVLLTVVWVMRMSVFITGRCVDA
ncbi:hypothetical protein ACFL4E_01705 [Candidatus Omnitrophota bacterium]